MNEAGGPALPQPRKASEWMVALLEAPDDPDLRRRFEAWLAADPAHVVDWNEASETIAALDDLRQERSERTKAPVPLPERRGRWAVLGVMTAMAAAIAIAVPGLMTRLQADHWTRVAEQRTVTLPDGSSVELAPETAIDVAFDHRRRLVRLLKGEALFNVLHQSERPFSVEANGVEVVDIGTAFDVRRRTGGVDVAVLEGVIEVTSPRSAPAVRERLQAGDWMRAVADRPAERGRMPVEEVAAWTRKRLVVKNQPVSEIVDALRPYFDGFILVRDETIARERLTGVYDLSNPVEAVRAIAHAQGASVIQLSPWILILSSRGAAVAILFGNCLPFISSSFARTDLGKPSATRRQAEIRMVTTARRARRRASAMKLAKVTAGAGALLGGPLSGAMAQGQPEATLIAQAARSFNIAAQPLADALTQFGQQSGLQVSVSAALLDRRTTPGVSGTMTPQEALRRLLSGSGLAGSVSAGGIVSVVPEPAPGGSSGALELQPVMVGAQLGQNLPPAFAGGQVARGASVGLLGDKDYMDTPFSISSYTAKTVRDQQARSVAEVLTNNDPSVRAAIGIGNRYDAMTIRGFRVGNGDIAINGLYGLVPEFRINPAPAERIELLKGPAAFLNGMAPQGGVGGNVNVVTKRAEDDPLTRVAIDYFSNSTFSLVTDVARRFGNDKEYGIRVNGTFTDGDTPIDRQWVRNGSLSLGFDYRGQQLRVSADLLYQNDYMAGAARGYTPIAGIQVPAAPNPRINLAQTYDYAHQQSTTGIVRVEYDIAPSTVAYAAFGGNLFNYDKREAPGPTILSYAGAARSTSTFQVGQTSNFTGEAGFRTKFTTGPISHEVAVSTSLLRQQLWLGQTNNAAYLTNIYAPTLGVPLTQTAYTPFSLASTNLLGSFAIADTLQAIDGKVQLILGGRSQQIESASFAASGATTFRYTDSALTPSVALLVKPIKELTLYGSYIQGLSPSSAPPPGVANPGQVFPPFRSTQFEVGAKLDFGTFGATLAAFRINQPNGIVNPVTNVYGINGEQRNQGIEFNMFGQLWNDFRVLGGFAVLDARLTQTAGGRFNGNYAVGAPPFQANLGLEYDLPFAPGLTAIARGLYTSASYVSSDNTQQVPAWATLDIGARYRTTVAKTPIVLRANVTNLLDSNYWIANPTGYVISGMPRMAWISLQADF